MTKDMAETRRAVIDILAALPGQRRPAEQITDTDSLWQDLHLDSLQAIEFVLALEDKFDIIIPDEELLRQDVWMSTVSAVVDFVHNIMADSC